MYALYFRCYKYNSALVFGDILLQCTIYMFHVEPDNVSVVIYQLDLKCSMWNNSGCIC